MHLLDCMRVERPSNKHFTLKVLSNRMSELVSLGHAPERVASQLADTPIRQIRQNRLHCLAQHARLVDRMAACHCNECMHVDSSMLDDYTVLQSSFMARLF